MADRYRLRLSPELVAAMRADITDVAEQVIAAVTDEVPVYRDPFSGRMGRNIEVAVGVALNGFLDLVSRSERLSGDLRIDDVLAASVQLGMGEARSGRTLDALSQAYRVGARVAWREWSRTAVSAGLPADDLAQLAELVFAFIDQLSDASVSGHAEELARSGRLRERRLERLAAQLLAGEPESDLIEAAEAAQWKPPPDVAVIAIPEPRVPTLRPQLDPRALLAPDEATGLGAEAHLTVFVVPVDTPPVRLALTSMLRDIDRAIVGPARPWTRARSSFLRVAHAQRLGLAGDVDQHLATLVVKADPEAHADLRDRVLAPLAGLSPSARAKLTETLMAWLVHQGRRAEVAAALFVHEQTVRYRLGQLRELYGDRLTDPAFIREATIALAE